MIGLPYKLATLEQNNTPIFTGIVGAGQMGRGLVSQMQSMKGMRPTVLVDIMLSSAKEAFSNAGLLEGRDYAHAETVEAGNCLLAEGKFVVTTNTELATNCDAIHCVVDATGIPEVGAKVAVDAIAHKKHIVMLNVETDVCVGHILYKMATEAGVVYTGSAGDEPGAVLELYDFATALGFEVRAIGKGKNNKIDYDCTPHTVAIEARERGVNPKMLCSFKDGTKTMVEMTAMANATGFVPDVMGAHGPKSTVKDLPNLLSLKSEGRGGVLNRYGVVEYVDGVAPGVFLIFSTDQKDALHELAYLSMGDGPNFCLYRPYHLCSLETPISVARACIDREPTIVPRAGLIAEVGTVSKIDLKAGDPLDGMGGFTIRGTFIGAHEAKAKNVLPMSIVNQSTKMRKDVKKGELITYDDVELDENSLMLRLRRKQDAMFG
ncbi:MAG: NAD(P)-dependent oxidoreductase [Oscillospiraceae bacterium]|nr:NAD(P)-dependent oxidoreductase [Oscillospiraceae bacterium]